MRSLLFSPAKQTCVYRVSLFRIIAAACLALICSQLFTHWVYVPSGSMLPTLNIGEIVLAKRVSDTSTLKRGTIAVFYPPHLSDGTLYVKRIIGRPGETIKGENGCIYINGQKLEEDYLADSTTTSDFGPIRIPPDCFFMLGDNRGGSYDSRYFGVVHKDRITSTPFIHFNSLAGRLLISSD